ncbi:MAG: hemolysin D [Legionella sp.]|nr:MAG: hemolysin D [Legionella sp.]PJD99012.1 MAG: hemolysin D [Legionella sp.]
MRFIIWIVTLTCCLASCKEEKHLYNGYIDADLVYLSSSYPGRLIDLAVSRGQSIKKGKLLFKLDHKNNDRAISISQLQEKSLSEQKNEILHQMQYEELNYQRVKAMRQKDAASQNDLEQAVTRRAVLKDQLASLDFQLKSHLLNTAQQKWERAQKEAYATFDGIVYDTYFLPQEYVQSGQPILSLLSSRYIKVIFFVSEPDLDSIKLQSKVKLFSDNILKGMATITYVAKEAQYTPPVIYSRENNHNLVFRVEARIDNPDLKVLHLGLPVSLELV